MSKSFPCVALGDRTIITKPPGTSGGIFFEKIKIIFAKPLDILVAV